nr:hypothetical protein CFP56_16483 [Quercus suber]
MCKPWRSPPPGPRCATQTPFRRVGNSILNLAKLNLTVEIIPFRLRPSWALVYAESDRRKLDPCPIRRMRCFVGSWPSSTSRGGPQLYAFATAAPCRLRSSSCCAAPDETGVSGQPLLRYSDKRTIDDMSGYLHQRP